MPPRYIALTAHGRLDRQGARYSGLLSRATQEYGLVPIFDDGDLIVLASAETPFVPIAEAGGVVIGHLFHRDEQARPVRLGEPLVGRSATESIGTTLLTGGWGGYVAILADPWRGRVHILRDPSGVMPCFHATVEGWGICFSDLEPVLGLGLLSASPDAGFVAHYLAFRGLRTARTGLQGVTEILAGTRVSFGGSEPKTDCCWTPWTFADRAAQTGDRNAAVRAVRAETERCVRAWAATSRSILLELSGGIDSSIVAVCLAGQAASVSCVTLVTPDPGADERRYAALAAGTIDAPLAAIDLKASSADLRRPPRIALPRPGLGPLQQVIDQAFLAVAQEWGVDAFFGGGGGDNVFCYLATAAPAVDAWLIQGPGPTVLNALNDLSGMYNCTVWHVAWLALKKRLRGPGPPWKRDLRFLRHAAAPADPDHHPWLERPAGALPGKIEHVFNLMGIQSAPDGKDRPLVAPVRHPLLSQPLMELCLTIPSWMWITGGLTRSVARDAFKDRLPQLIADRRSKGEFVGFTGEIYERNRKVLAELLIGGWLDRAGILDRAAIEAYLAAPGPPRDPHFFRLLEIAGVETWVRSWADGQPAAAAGF